LYLASAALMVLADIPVPWGPVVLGYALAIALVAGYGAVHLWRMPPETRLLFRTRRVGLALGAVYGAVLIELITAAVTPAGALPFAIFATTALILASPFVARASLRCKGNKAGRDATHDRATSR
jgi:hypothetical protein